MAQHNLEGTSPNAAKEAREQAEAYRSLLAGGELELDNGETIKIPPHPEFGIMDDDTQEEYEDYMFFVDTECEREPDVIIPAHRMKNDEGVEVGPLYPEETIRGALKQPLRQVIDGKAVRLTPSHRTKLVQIVLGDLKYKQLQAGGKGAGDVWKLWNEQGLEVKERQGRSQADGSAVGLAAVPTPDSQ